MLGKVALYRTELRSHQSVLNTLGRVALFASIHFEQVTTLPLRFSTLEPRFHSARKAALFRLNELLYH